MKVKVLQVFEFAAHRAEQGFHRVDVVVHRAADVQQQQHLGAVVQSGVVAQVQKAGLAGGGGDGGVDVQFFGGAVAGKLAQPAQGDFHAARAQLAVAVQIAKFALIPHFDRPAVA